MLITNRSSALLRFHRPTAASVSRNEWMLSSRQTGVLNSREISLWSTMSSS